MSTFGLLRYIPGAFVVGNQIKHGGRELDLAAFGVACKTGGLAGPARYTSARWPRQSACSAGYKAS